MKCSLGISNFLEEIFILSHSIVFHYLFSLIAEEGFLVSPCFSLDFCIQMGISFLFSFAFHFSFWGFPGGCEVKASAWNAGDPGSILGQEDPLEKEMATHFSSLSWRTPWTEEPGGLQSMWSQSCTGLSTHRHFRVGFISTQTLRGWNTMYNAFLKNL